MKNIIFLIALLASVNVFAQDKNDADHVGIVTLEQEFSDKGSSATRIKVSISDQTVPFYLAGALGISYDSKVTSIVFNPALNQYEVKKSNGLTASVHGGLSLLNNIIKLGANAGFEKSSKLNDQDELVDATKSYYGPEVNLSVRLAGKVYLSAGASNRSFSEYSKESFRANAGIAIGF
ncbi:MAG: hypothetical protein JNM93_11780 [Bacteriovoracaceae bacterium]|nr:hypothetical protein [Bacteriovoracaceae bacterium]